MFTPIKLDRMRNFRYGMKAISLIEKKLNTKISNLDMENMSMEETATLIWAGLVWEDKDLTVDRVMDIIDENSNFVEVIKVMGEAFTAAFGNGESEKK